MLLTLNSCTPKEYDFELNQKYVLLTTEINGIEIRDKIIHDPLLSFTIRDKKYYPAIRFNRSDSSVIVPGANNNKEILDFSANKNLKNIVFSRRKDSLEDTLVDKLFLKNFKIKKDPKLGELILETDSVKIRMLPSERFANRIKSMHLD